MHETSASTSMVNLTSASTPTMTTTPSAAVGSGANVKGNVNVDVPVHVSMTVDVNVSIDLDADDDINSRSVIFATTLRIKASMFVIQSKRTFKAKTKTKTQLGKQRTRGPPRTGPPTCGRFHIISFCLYHKV